MRIPILHLDPDLIVVDKPAGVPTHAADPADPYPADALRIVQAQTGLPYLGMHQRLDAETSGVLLFSARREANRALAAAFEGRAVRKVYLALAWGAPPRDEGVIDAPIARDRGGRYRVAAPGDPRGLPARTRYRVLETFPAQQRFPETTGDNAKAQRSKDAVSSQQLRAFASSRSSSGQLRGSALCTLLELIPETGRPHQIRVHLAHIGCPVAGDPLYGPAECPALRLCLHAWQLTLPHPATGKATTFVAPAPDLLSVSLHVPLDDPRTSSAAAGGAAPDGDHRGGDFSRSVQPGATEVATTKTSTYRAQDGKSVPPIRDAIRSPDVVRALLRLAIERRAPLAADPSTTIYRLVNGAADGLSGLTADRYGDALVVAIYDDDCAAPRPLPAPLVELLAEVTGAASIYVKYRPRQASRIADDQLGMLAPPRPAYGFDVAEFIAHEDGLPYLIRPGAGLSVGLFPDMREGRGRVRAWAAGRRVLNTFAYTCGFGVAATAGGAARVLNLDLSKPALAWGQENYRANGLDPDPHDFVYGDVFDWLARLARRGDRFDLVIMDPPGFSRAKTRRFSAAQDYGELAGLAAQVTATSGLLLACCNVAELPWRGFRERVLAGLAASGRTATVRGVYHEPAVDFPTPVGGEPYLKMLLLEVGA